MNMCHLRSVLFLVWYVTSPAAAAAACLLATADTRAAVSSNAKKKWVGSPNRAKYTLYISDDDTCIDEMQIAFLNSSPSNEALLPSTCKQT